MTDRAPRIPESEDDHLALKLAETVKIAVQCFGRKIRCCCSRAQLLLCRDEGSKDEQSDGENEGTHWLVCVVYKNVQHSLTNIKSESSITPEIKLPRNSFVFNYLREIGPC